MRQGGGRRRKKIDRKGWGEGGGGVSVGRGMGGGKRGQRDSRIRCL